MENIVAHSFEKLYTEFEQADQLFLDSGMKDMDVCEKGLAAAARRAAAEHMQALYNSMDQMLCDDILRNAKYTIQRHDTGELLTINGPICFTHTLFRNREDGGYHCLLDEWLGLDAHERPSCAAETAVPVEAAKSSYSRAAKALGKDTEISRTAVMDKVHAVQAELPFEKPVKKKCVDYLYIEADEDHIHKQEKAAAEKKSGMTGKLLYLYEGRVEKDGHVSHVYSERMSSGPMGWSEAGADAMCRLRCYVRDYGEDRVIDLVRYRRSHREEKAAGCEESEPKFARGYLKKLLHGQHDSDRVYLERIQATIPGVEIRKKLAIRERLSNI